MVSYITTFISNIHMLLEYYEISLKQETRNNSSISFIEFLKVLKVSFCGYAFVLRHFYSQLKEVLSMDKKLVHLEHENRELKKLLEENKKTQRYNNDRILLKSIVEIWIVTKEQR